MSFRGGAGAEPRQVHAPAWAHGVTAVAVLTGAALVGAAEPLWGWHGQSLAIGLALIAVLTAITAARRTLRLASRLRSGGPV